jgi:hypothetical protein
LEICFRKTKTNENSTHESVAEIFLTCNTDVTIQAPIYAEVDLAKKTKHKEEINIPMYAQVDKSKKRVSVCLL